MKNSNQDELELRCIDWCKSKHFFAAFFEFLYEKKYLKSSLSKYVLENIVDGDDTFLKSKICYG